MFLLSVAPSQALLDHHFMQTLTVAITHSLSLFPLVPASPAPSGNKPPQAGSTMCSKETPQLATVAKTPSPPAAPLGAIPEGEEYPDMTDEEVRGAGVAYITPIYDRSAPTFGEAFCSRGATLFLTEAITFRNMKRKNQRKNPMV